MPAIAGDRLTVLNIEDENGCGDGVIPAGDVIGERHLWNHEAVHRMSIIISGEKRKQDMGKYLRTGMAFTGSGQYQKAYFTE